MQPREQELPIPELHITNFRAIREAKFTDLRPLTIIAGPNDSGKTTILDALHLYASRGDPDTIRRMLQKYDQFTLDPDSKEATPDRDALFHQRNTDLPITIGAGDQDLTISVEPQDVLAPTLTVSRGTTTLRITTEDRSDYRFLHRPSQMNASFNPIPCAHIGPHTPTNQEIAHMWDNLTLTTGETRALETISEATQHRIERIGSMVGEGQRRRPMVKIAGEAKPRPLRSLGHSALQIVAIALGTESARGGFLLLDEPDSALTDNTRVSMWATVISQDVLVDTQIFLATNRSSTTRYVLDAAHRAPVENVSRIHIQ